MPSVRRDNKNDNVNAVRAGGHVADEIHVPRHVHDADHAFVRQLAGGEAEVNGEAALFFLASVSVSQPVSIFTSALLPWSTCPAVPSMMFRREALMAGRDGVVEYWSSGVLEWWSVEVLKWTHHSRTPSLHHSDFSPALHPAILPSAPPIIAPARR